MDAIGDPIMEMQRHGEKTYWYLRVNYFRKSRSRSRDVERAEERRKRGGGGREEEKKRVE